MFYSVTTSKLLIQSFKDASGGKGEKTLRSVEEKQDTYWVMGVRNP